MPLRLPLLLVGLVLAACGAEDGGETAATPAPTTEVTPTATAATTATPPPGEAGTSVPSPDGTTGDDDPAADCSAASLPAEVEPQESLPPAVARTRADIVRAAVACDYARLQALTSEQGFTFSFGVADDAAAHWRGLERQGERPLAILAGLLSLPPAETEQGFHVWPAAHAGRPTESDWRQLEAIYSAEEIGRLRQADGYLGHRIGIDADGEWRYFVAGD